MHSKKSRTRSLSGGLGGRLLTLGAGLCLAGGPLWAAQPEDETGDTRLATVVVEGATRSAAQKAEEQLKKVPGAAVVVDNKEVEKGRATNAEDVFALQPGIFAQATSGSGANKISIRGSGLNSFYQGYALGIKYLFDGLPITGPGGTQEDYLSMNGIDHTEVLYGANAFDYAATTLGGAINFVTHSGYTAPGNYVRLEGGSFGYRKQQLSTGGVVDGTDYYVSIFNNERDGYQHNTPNKGQELVANLGQRFNDKLDTRLIVRYREETLTQGNTLTREQIKHDSNSNKVPTGRKKDGSTWVGSTTTYRFDDDSRLQLGLSVNDYPLLNGWRYSTTPQDWRSTDTNLTLRYLREQDRLFGLPSDTTLTFSSTRSQLADVKSHSRATGKLLQQTDYSGSRDTVFALGNELQLDPRLWLVSGLSAINIDRDVRIEYTTGTNTSEFPDSVSYNKWYAAPRIGLRYQLTPDVQLFGNASRSIDPPVTWQLGSTSVPYIRPVTPQKADTLEVGIRGSVGVVDGSLTLYRSWVKDELLSVVVSQATSTSDALVANSNASPTIHQGIEAGLGIQLWEGASGDRLSLRQAWTLNDFHYRGDSTFGDNELPSLPRQVYQAQLNYQRHDGYYAELNARAASSYYVDYANTLGAPSYTLWGAKLGYQAPGQRWEVFLDLRNLTNEHYATAANTAYDAKGKDSANFYPGDPFNVTAGLAFRF